MAGILNVGDVKKGYEVYKMVSGEEQGGYSITAFAKKDGFEYFMKMYQSPTAVSPAAQQEYFKNRIFKLMGKLGVPKIKNFIAQDKEFFLDEATGRYIKISELLRGVQLSKILASEPYNNDGVTLSEALKYATLISFAFRNIHELGITHGDLKPDNIFIEERETLSGAKTKTVVLIDFDSAIISDLPKPKEIVGTPGYYSPEHLIHDNVDENIWPSTSSDVFTLGIIFYELFTGNKPFPGVDKDGSLMETAMIIINEEKMPDAPSEMMPDIPSGISELILSMLSADEKKRPAVKVVHEKLIEISSSIPETTESMPIKEEILPEVSAPRVTYDFLAEEGLMDPAQINNTGSDSPAKRETSPASASGSSTVTGVKLAGPAGEFFLKTDTGLSQISARTLSGIGVMLNINAGRIYFDNAKKIWKLYTSKFAEGKMELNGVPLKNETDNPLKTGDVLFIGGVKVIFEQQETAIDTGKLKSDSDEYSKKRLHDKMAANTGALGNLTLSCMGKTIPVLVNSTFILSNRNLSDFELYSIKNLGSISVDMGKWKIYPSKFSEGVLWLDNNPVSHPTELLNGSILKIQDKEITVSY